MNRKDFSQNILIEKVLTPDEILGLVNKNQKINIMMGQTFDSGQPIDMMKYALFMMSLEDSISHKNTRVNSVWLIADHFMTDINRDKELREAQNQARARVDYLELLNKVYGGNIKFVFSSELSKTPEYQQNLKKLKEMVSENLEFKEKVLQAVPEDRRDNPSAINYPLEELAVIQTLKANIKIGPKYEIMYDLPARDFSKMTGFTYSAIHLTNCFPFGSPTIAVDVKKEIEEFGILPYKLDSKNLGSYRIDPINHNLKRIEDFIRVTRDPRAIDSLLITLELAKRRLDHNFSFGDLPSYRSINLERRKEIAIKGYKEYVFKSINERK